MLIKNLFKSKNSKLLQVTFRFYSKGTVSKHYDVVIAGGGMVGTSLACTLGKNTKLREKRVLLLEACPNKAWGNPEKYSNRVVSINPSSQKLFSDLGAWKFIEKHRFAPVKQLQVWDALSDASVTFGNAESQEIVSYIVENDLLLAALTEEVKNCDNVNVLYNAKVTKYGLPDYEGNIVNITLDNGDEYTCDLLLGCDGVNSSVRKSMQADYVSWSYNQMGVVATLKLKECMKNEIAWQRFLPNGPVALLPLTDELSSLVWSTSPEEARRLLSVTEEEFVEALNKAIWSKYSSSIIVQQATSIFDTFLRVLNCSKSEKNNVPPTVKSIEPNSRAAFPLGFGHSSQYIGKGVALVGDAAHRVHPLAGQGVNLGFGDVACLSNTLGEAVYDGSTISKYFKVDVVRV